MKTAPEGPFSCHGIGSLLERRNPLRERLLVVRARLHRAVLLLVVQGRDDGGFPLRGGGAERRAHLLRSRHVVAREAAAFLRQIFRCLGGAGGGERQGGQCDCCSAFHASCLRRKWVEVGPVYSFGALCPTPLWQSIQVPLPARTASWIGRT